MSRADTPSEYDVTDDDLRKEIIHIASQHLEHATSGDGIYARKAGPHHNDRATRVGWERLTEYFNLAYGGAGAGRYEEHHVKYLDGQWQSWCGIFALYCIKTAGVKIGNWKNGVGIRSLLKPTRDPKPGDIGYFVLNQHHCVIVAIDGDTITTIDGNFSRGGGRGSS